ncbi:hypothetical protein CRE_18672 [Caenorhabditis remanei]|uniref:Uncharacterized protein n=2 Tax=Caenorhabditis remanei TaxID=31234 RepID=E3LKX4_CAERE|nr:hypothetical protein CRE_18672 [Caenorhabditis remanei]
MTSQLVFCFLLLAATVTAWVDYGDRQSPKKLSYSENLALQQSCGRDAHYRTKVLNGDGPQDYPWAAVVNVKGLLTASVISPRHILLFNVFEMDKEGNRTILNDTKVIETGYCDDDNDWVLPKEVHPLFHVKFVNEQFGEASANRIRRIVALSGCDFIDPYKPLILELENDLTFDKTHGAICIPKKQEESSVSLVEDDEPFTVFGLGPKGKILTAAQFTKKECKKDQVKHVYNHVFCGKPVNASRGLCAGDFGGGAITNIDGRNVIVGVYAEGNVRCDNAPQYHQEPEFIDITAYTGEICRHTGVCPDAVDILGTSTDGVYIPGEETETTEESYATEPSTTESTESPETGSTFSLETIIAETYEKMKLNNCSANEHKEEQPKEIHIHIHLDKDAKINVDNF